MERVRTGFQLVGTGWNTDAGTATSAEYSMCHCDSSRPVNDRLSRVLFTMDEFAIQLHCGPNAKIRFVDVSAKSGPSAGK